MKWLQRLLYYRGFARYRWFRRWVGGYWYRRRPHIVSPFLVTPPWLYVSRDTFQWVSDADAWADRNEYEDWSTDAS